MKGFATWAFVLALAANAEAASAQQVAAGLPTDEAKSSVEADGNSVLGEIVVTAQKRSQNVTDVGATIAVANSLQLQSAGIADVSQLSAIVPGLTTATSQQGYPVFSIRGVNFNAPQLSAPPAASVYLDEAPVPFSFMTAGMLYDVDHVEVLKGPQGTLFGQNATGGSINIIPAKPTASLSAGVRADVNHFGETRLEGFVSGPLSDQLRARVAATTTQFGAWQRGYFLNNQKNGSQNKSAGRLLLDWTPTDRLKIAVDVEGRYDHGEGQQAQLAIVQVQVPSNPPPGLIGYPLPSRDRDSDFDQGLDTHARNSLFQASLRVEYKLADEITLTSITNYIDAKYRSPHDIDGTALIGLVYAESGHFKTFSQEVRINGSALDKKLNYIIGGNYENDKIDNALGIDLINYSGFPPNSHIDAIYHPRNRAGGIFGNADFEIVKGLTLTGGVRYTDTKQETTGCSIGNAQATSVFGFIAGLLNPAAGAAYTPGVCMNINDIGSSPSYLPTSTNREVSQTNVSWRAGVNFKPDNNTLIYGLVSRGYKSGLFPVFGVVLESQVKHVSQERLTSYEAGVKLEFLDNHVRLNGSVFYYQYANKQFSSFVPSPIGVINNYVNIPKSSVRGFDLDVTVVPVSKLTLKGAMTYIKTKIGQYKSFNGAGVLVDYQGTEFNFAPPLSLTADAEYTVHINDAIEAFIGGSVLYNQRTFADLGEVSATRLPAYTLLNARVGVRSQKGWDLSLWVRNMANEYYWTNVGPGGDTLSKFSGLPRTFGLSAGVRF